MSIDQVSFIDIDFILYYVQHLTLALNFAVRSIMTKYQMFQDVEYHIEGFKTNISTHFK